MFLNWTRSQKGFHLRVMKHLKSIRNEFVSMFDNRSTCTDDALSLFISLANLDNIRSNAFHTCSIERRLVEPQLGWRQVSHLRYICMASPCWKRQIAAPPSESRSLEVTRQTPSLLVCLSYFLISSLVTESHLRKPSIRIFPESSLYSGARVTRRLLGGTGFTCF